MKIEYLEAPLDEPPSYNSESRDAALHAEEVRERDWAELEATALDFARAYGIGGLLRCIGRAVSQQKDLPL